MESSADILEELAPGNIPNLLEVLKNYLPDSAVVSQP